MGEPQAWMDIADPAGDFFALTRKISLERGFGCASYKDKCLRRRVAVRLRARGVHTYEDYARVLDNDAAEYDRLLEALTINVTKLFRNWDVYASIATNVIPALFNSERSRIRVWSAGCSSGDEPFSLAILFHRHAATTGMLAQLGRVEIVGTDIDRKCLEAAERGQFEEGHFGDTPDELRRQYFSSVRPFTVVHSVRNLVRFESRDLIRESPPPSRHDLIVCRNVLIYFDRETQERLFEVFYESLAPNGYLVLGKVETLLGRSRSRFVPVDARERIFRRL
jgi:chemotaxis protein methyltransferase CheR